MFAIAVIGSHVIMVTYLAPGLARRLLSHERGRIALVDRRLALDVGQRIGSLCLFIYDVLSFLLVNVAFIITAVSLLSACFLGDGFWQFLAWL